MHLDSSTGEDWLFGTTRSISAAESGDWVYLWKVRLDPASHDPLASTVKCYKASNQFEGKAFVTGVRPTLDNGTMHMTFLKDDASFHYFIFDWSANITPSAEIFDGVFQESMAYTVFVGSRRELTQSTPPLNRWQGYSGLVKQTF